MAETALTASGYIKHHLQNLTYGEVPEGYEHAGSWGFAHSAEEAKDMGFMAIHVDTMFWSILLGVLFLFVFRKAANVRPRVCPAVCKILWNGSSNLLIAVCVVHSPQRTRLWHRWR